MSSTFESISSAFERIPKKTKVDHDHIITHLLNEQVKVINSVRWFLLEYVDKSKCTDDTWKRYEEKDAEADKIDIKKQKDCWCIEKQKANTLLRSFVDPDGQTITGKFLGELEQLDKYNSTILKCLTDEQKKKKCLI